MKKRKKKTRKLTKARIRAIRDKLDLTQPGFGKLLGVSFLTISRWENGHFRPVGVSREVLLYIEERIGSVKSRRLRRVHNEIQRCKTFTDLIVLLEYWG